MSTEIKAYNSDEAVELSDKQRLAIVHLLTGIQKKDAAAAVGVEPETLSRWFAIPEFEAELNTARKDAYSAGIERLRWLQWKALDVLESQLDNPVVSLKEKRRLALDMVRISVRLPEPTGQTDAYLIRNPLAIDFNF